jgi:mannose-6-phosphate isomerase
MSVIGVLENSDDGANVYLSTLPMTHAKLPTSNLSALPCTPLLVERPWGGTRLQAWGRDCAGRKVGESWEVCGLPGFQTPFGVGGWADLGALAGDAADPLELGGKEFPLLLKLIDAAENLSIQLHPYVVTPEGAPKTEAWVILDAQEGASLYAGVRERMGRVELIERVGKGDLSVLEQIPVKTGDVVFIPGGTLHAITAGLLIAEIQQSSDTTWRVWDWNRKDAQGNGRTLHLRQAIRDVDPVPRAGLLTTPLADGQGREFLVACPSFTACRHQENAHIEADSSWRILLQVGEGGLLSDATGTRDFGRGQTLLLPRGCVANTMGGQVLEFWVADLEREVLEPLLQAGHPQSAIRALGAGTW